MLCESLARLRPHVRTLFDFEFFTKSAYSENARSEIGRDSYTHAPAPGKNTNDGVEDLNSSTLLRDRSRR